LSITASRPALSALRSRTLIRPRGADGVQRGGGPSPIVPPTTIVSGIGPTAALPASRSK
jgi:hypothetical protein